MLVFAPQAVDAKSNDTKCHASDVNAQCCDDEPNAQCWMDPNAGAHDDGTEVLLMPKINERELCPDLPSWMVFSFLFSEGPTEN